MNLITFKLVTPEKTVLNMELVSLTCPTTTGQITILPNHEPLISTLVPGEMKAKTSDEEYLLNVAGGFVQVQAGSQVVVLADAAEHSYEIDLKRAEEAKKRAEAAMKEVRVNQEEYAKVAAALERSLARLNVARKRSRRKNPITSEGILEE
ncbi:MAG: ATP synthase F1 subunit epsilon [Candidatus Doudnabacteria bacterium]|nr:ATP synthase F1 subunit epsilon [Candidatus Doudnabacteria bacterium]